MYVPMYNEIHKGGISYNYRFNVAVQKILAQFYTYVLTMGLPIALGDGEFKRDHPTAWYILQHD